MKSKEEKAAYSREYYKKNAEKCRRYAHDYSIKNKERKSLKEKERYRNNKDHYRKKIIKQLYGQHAVEIVNELYKKQGSR